MKIMELYPNTYSVLGIPIAAVNLKSLATQLVNWASQEKPRTIFVRDVHGLIRAVENDALRQMHLDADMVIPDGAPIAMLGKIRGYAGIIGRTPGADVVEAVCAASIASGHSHFFFGGQPGVAEAMKQNLLDKYPNLKIAGIFAPPMMILDAGHNLDQQRLDEIALIRDTRPSFIWVGISTPKQEIWMTKAAPLVGNGVFIGVGAAFDFHAKLVQRAPLWMRKMGIEWLHRLLSEPKRLWRRYLIDAPKFVMLASFEQLAFIFNIRH